MVFKSTLQNSLLQISLNRNRFEVKKLSLSNNVHHLSFVGFYQKFENKCEHQHTVGSALDEKA